MSKLTQLELLLDIIDLGSLAKAAERNNFDRSAVSKQLKLLEKDLGVVLINRSTRSISLTPAGQAVVEKARQIRMLLNEVHTEAQLHQQEPQGTLRITSFTSFGINYLTKVVSSFIHQYPKVEIKLTLDDKRTNIIQDNYDLAFRIGPPKDSDLIAIPILPNRIRIVATPSFLQQHQYPQTLSQLTDLPCVIYSNDEFCFDQFECCVAESSTKPPIKFHMHGRLYVNNTQAQLDAIRQGVGYGLISQSTFSQPLEELGLVSIFEDHADSIEEGLIYALYPSRNQTPLVSAFISAVKTLAEHTSRTSLNNSI